MESNELKFTQVTEHTEESTPLVVDLNNKIIDT